MNLKKCFEKIQLISELEENWDGYDASVPSEKVINNTYDFLETIHQYNTDIKVDDDEIVPTPYGSITIDLYPFDNDKVLVSIEIGEKQIGWFTRCLVGGKIYKDAFESDGIDCVFKTLPNDLKYVLDFFYKHLPIEI